MKLPESLKARYIQLKALQRYGPRPASATAAVPSPRVQQPTGCLNCGTQFVGQYCPHCGQPAQVRRLTLRQSIHDVLNVFVDVERGFLRTCLELCYRPGYMIRDYLQGRRVCYYRPVKLLFFLSTILLVLHFLLYQQGFADADVNASVQVDDQVINRINHYGNLILQSISDNPALLYLVITILMVLPAKLCFCRTEVGRRLNWAEQFYAMVFISCQLLIYKLFTMPYDRLITSSDQGLGLSFGLPLLLLLSWDFSQLYGIRFRRSLRLTLLALFLTLILLILTVVLFVLILYLLFPEQFRSALS